MTSGVADSIKEEDELERAYAEIFSVSDRVRIEILGGVSWEDLFFREDLQKKFADHIGMRLLSEIEQRVGRPVIGMGTSRIVVEMSPTRVVKFAIHPYLGAWQNMNEVKTWYASDGEWWRDALVPVVSYDRDGRWVEMPRAIRFREMIRPAGGHELYDDAYKEFRGVFKDRMKRDGRFNMRDAHSGNMGMYNGKLRILDYGILMKSDEGVLRAMGLR